MLSSEFGTQFQKDITLFLEILEFPCNTVCDEMREAFMPQRSSSCFNDNASLLGIDTELA